MALTYHPPRASVVKVNYDKGFVPPEMVKPRLAVVISKPIKQRHGLCTVVPLSMTAPPQVMPFHCELAIPFKLPTYWGQSSRWVKGDMICAVSWNRVDLLSLGKDDSGRRIYQTKTLDDADFDKVLRCVLHGLGMSTLTKNL